MSKFECSACGYTSVKADVLRHITKKNKCGDNPILSIIRIEIKCEKCEKNFSSIKTLSNHIKICKIKNKIHTLKIEKLEETNKKLEETNKKLKEHIEWLRPQDQLGRATQGYESAINFLMATDNSNLLTKFWDNTNQLDSIRQENILDSIPELQALK